MTYHCGRSAKKAFLRLTAIFLMALAPIVRAQDDLPYTTYTSFSQVLEGSDARYPAIRRVSDPGPSGHRAYTGFFFYQCLQFDTTARYLLGMRVYFQTRDVKPADRGDIGYIDLKDGFKWTKIGETTAWNWQQGSRLQWRPRSDEILWNDRSDDGKKYVCRVYNFRTGIRRNLSRPIYDLSPDGATALTHDFERMKHFKGTEYVGIEDLYEKQYAPSKTGIWKMNMDTGKAQLVISLERMAAIAFPKGGPSSGCLYFFREGWNPSGTRFVAFTKDPENSLADKAFSMTPDGTDVRYLYPTPSHHSWQDDNYILDFGKHTPPGGGAPLAGYFLFKDDGTGSPKELLWATDSSKFNGHDSYLPGPGGDWILSDTYSIDGYQYLFMYHRPTKLFVPLAKLKSTAEDAVGYNGEYRVDLHPRFSRDGRIVCVDATHEGLGRQMYIIDIGHILDHPPHRRASVQ
jgi:hypothetical protein